MTNQTTENNKRIAKNTNMLYLRMFLTMVVGLYTSRVVLQTLGVEDYGIYGSGRWNCSNDGIPQCFNVRCPLAFSNF